MTQLLILARDADVYAPLVEGADIPDLTIHACNAVAKAQAVVAECEVILGQPDMVAPVLSHAKKLSWVQSTFAGVDALCRKGLRRDYLLTGVKGIFGPLMSEYVFGYILAMERRMFAVRANQEGKVWAPLSYRSIRGLTLGVCGLGSIGEHVAWTGGHFGMRVIGYRRSGGHCDGVDRVFSGDDLTLFLGQCDYVVSVLPATGATRHLFDAEAFAAMKPSAVFMNVGRGITVSEKDLIDALHRQEIAGAVLDVFEEEPLGSGSPLWGMENVIITPHISAFSFPEEIVGIFCRNLAAFRQGQRLASVVNFDEGY
ncbi:2-hydroxyacid dehydrogenase [Desulfoluna limicola]|uniref:2-hydroxyacid dehydrogenase n=1 Tax=Desulfoluna limicola TaxID=2810562 RepID=A0ABN6F8V8_9BACT|nr:D-2-hydroxyacid dehydrogenase [Desulfoluna limicola]BCS98606.1 2-hydroxyacid dehydrogenase [Desulfoluna limicola]